MNMQLEKQFNKRNILRMTTIGTIVVVLLLVIGMAASQKVNAESKGIRIRVADAAAKKVVLTWKDAKCNSEYILYKAINNGKFKKVKAYKAGLKKYVYKNNNLSEKRTYSFKIIGTNKEGKTVFSNVCRKIKVEGNYKAGTPWGKRLSQKKRKYVKNKVAELVNCKLNQKKTTFDKVKTINDWMRKRTYYTMNGNDYYNAYGLLHNRKASCYGFACAFKAICDGAGIKSRIVYADKNSFNPYHAWNIVRVNKKWYVIDTEINMSISREVHYYESFLIGRDSFSYIYYCSYKNKKNLPKISKYSFRFKVTFVAKNGMKWTSMVRCGGNASCPDTRKVNSVKGYAFDKWDKPYTNIWRNTIIRAVYEKI